MVHIVGPSGVLKPHGDRLRQGIHALKSAGFRTHMADDLSTRNQRGYLAGGDPRRCEEFINAVADPSCDIVWWARGGSGAGRIVAEVVDSITHMKPKWLIGFSDATSLLNAISIKLGWVSIHGPTVTLLGDQPECLSSLVKLTGTLADESYRDPFGTLPIYGGNITVLASMMGCIDLAHLPPHRLLLEDVGESVYRLDRSLTQLRHAWPIGRTKEILLGDLDLPPETSRQIAGYITEDFGCNVRTEVKAGHRGYVSFIPLGHSPVVPCT